MKALVPAGTTGNSLRPLSHTMPEQLVPVANRPVLLHCLDNLREAGILDVCILVGPHDEAIQALVGDGSALALRVTYLVQHEPRGVAHGIGLAREFLGDDDFVVYLADNVVVGGIVELAERFEERRAEGVDDRRPAVQLCVTKVANPSAYGVVEVDHNGRVERVTEKPAQPRSDLAVMGVYFLTPAIHKAVRELRPNADGDYDLTDAVQWLVSRGHKVYAEMFSGYWKDTGRLDDVLECHRVLLEAVEP